MDQVQNKSRGYGIRVLMICDDFQIDRRILQEAEALVSHGYEVLVLGRAGDGYPASEIDGNVKVERVDYAKMAETRATRKSIQSVLDEGAEIGGSPMSVAAAEEQLSNILSVDESRLPRFPLALQRRGWLTRNLLKAIIWPPFRLAAIRRYVPGMPLTLQYVLYLPTLAMTPRPAAIKWHWERVKRRFNLRLPIKSSGRAHVPPDFQTERAKHIEREVARFEDMNIWEIALYERGCFFRPDIVHVHDLPQLRPGYFMGRKFGVPVVYDAHELYPVIHTLTPIEQERLAVMEYHYIRKVAKTIIVNPFLAKRQVEDYGIPAPRVLLNAAILPDSLKSGPRPNIIRESLGLPQHAKVLLFQGWVSFERRIGDLVEAMASVPDHVHLVLLGYGTDIPRLKEMAVNLGIAHRIHFPPPVPQRELMQWVASADAGMIPYQPIDDNHLYCSPNKLFEFIAAGVPIVANDLPYLRSVVANHGFGVVRPLRAPKDYAEAINKMFEGGRGGETRFHRAVAERAAPFLWPAQERVLMEIYDGLSGKIRADRVASAQRKQTVEPTVSRVSSANAQTRGRKLRIFHGMYNIAGIPAIMARAEREIGLDSKAVCFPSGHFGYQPDIVEQHTVVRSELLARFRRYASEFDVFVFHFGYSLANDTLADIPLLKQMGKTVIFYFHGCDIRQSKETIRKYEFSACKVCWPQLCSPNRDLALDMAMRYADAVWVSTPDLLEFVPGAELFLQPIDVQGISAAYRPRRSTSAGRGQPLRLIHAPSDPKLKGTAYLTQAVSMINATRNAVDLELIIGMSNEHLKERMVESDVAVDQLLSGSYGMFAVELMASGVPVICYIREDLLPLYPERPPLIVARPDNVQQVLEEILGDQSTLESLARDGREYVREHHSAHSAALRASEVYCRHISGS